MGGTFSSGDDEKVLDHKISQVVPLSPVCTSSHAPRNVSLSNRAYTDFIRAAEPLCHLPDVVVETIFKYWAHTSRHVLIVGGHDLDSDMKSVEIFNYNKKVWSYSSFCVRHRFGAGAGMINGNIYVCGGLNSKSLEMYDSQTKKWGLLADMSEIRFAPAAAEVNGQLYVCGGFKEVADTTAYTFHDSCYSDTAERYDPVGNVWSKVPNMNGKRYQHAAVTYSGKLYVFGGEDGHSALSVAELYDPSKQEWVKLADMNSARDGAAAVVAEDYIIVCGGQIGNCPLKTVEMYHPATDKWFPLPDMLTRRFKPSAVVLDDCVLIMGGSDGVSVLKSCEKLSFGSKDMESSNSTSVLDTWVKQLQHKHVHVQNVKVQQRDEVCVNAGTKEASRSADSIVGVGAVRGVEGTEAAHNNSNRPYTAWEWEVATNMLNKRFGTVAFAV